jgi:hypothetical protein
MIDSIITIQKEPFMFDSEHPIGVDVDNTLAKWSKKHNIPGEGRIKVLDPYSGELVYLKPHLVHIRLMRQYKARGYSIVVWSKAGRLWAKAVCEAFGITDIVDMYMTKMEKVIDDKSTLEDIVGNRVYLEDRESD